MMQSEGFVEGDPKAKVCLLQKAIIYSKDGVTIILPVFVDDITLASQSESAIQFFITQLSQHFKFCDLGPTTQLLGIKIDRDCPKHSISLSQRQYCLDVFDRFGMADCKPISTPMEPSLHLSHTQIPQNAQECATMCQTPYLSAIGALMYLATTTCPDIAYTVGILARFNSNPCWTHWLAVKHLLHYIKGIIDYSIIYSHDPAQPETFIMFSDADHDGCKDTGHSTGGYVVKMGTGAVSWSSKLQNIVALSTTEAEYMAAVQAGKEIKWMHNLMHRLPENTLCFFL